MSKFIFVTGGVVSSLGKGITAASMGRLLVNQGLKVAMQKFDPYINVDPGTMSPYQHGEVFVTDDGAETDLDLGHYERFTGQNLTRLSNVTSGQVYWTVLSKERRGDFLGGTIQVIPHITDEIKSRIHTVAQHSQADVVIVEIGGTVGDIESLPFLEAIRQFRSDVGRENVMYVHVTLVPYLSAAREMKTKPTQHSVKELRGVGIQPDVIVCRTERPLTEELRKKIGLFCDIDSAAVIENMDQEVVYQVPKRLAEQNLDGIIRERLGLPEGESDWTDWDRVLQSFRSPDHRVTIAIVGKYIELKDAYISVVEAIRHGGIAHNTRVHFMMVQSEDLEKYPPKEILRDVDGIVVPGGFGYRGIEGKINAARYARENQIPYLGLCLGMQIAVVEFARNVCGFMDANSTEFVEDTLHPVIHLLPSQKDVSEKGGTMRLGIYPCHLAEGSTAQAAYRDALIHERHRHRYEFNNEYRDVMEEKGLWCSGIYRDEDLVEIIEIKGHPWFVASQFHPEFKSKPTDPHPLFAGFVGAAVARNSQK